MPLLGAHIGVRLFPKPPALLLIHFHLSGTRSNRAVGCNNGIGHMVRDVYLQKNAVSYELFPIGVWVAL